MTHDSDGPRRPSPVTSNRDSVPGLSRTSESVQVDLTRIQAAVAVTDPGWTTQTQVSGHG